jgi:acyl-lipid omega-6 desaturase (Delta-12 desaturase)
MRSGKELIAASKVYTGEIKSRSWQELILTLVLLVLSFSAMFLAVPVYIRLFFTLLTSLFYVRAFVIYHDYQHRAILQNSKLATLIMRAIGVYLLTPENIWKRSHEHHHNHNSKLTIIGIGSYPTINVDRFVSLSKTEKSLYLINRHPLTVIMGYFTLFIYWLNLKSFIQSPGKHLDSLFALIFHVAAGAAIWFFLGFASFLICWFIPFFLAFAMGSYLFYCQHNFPGAVFRENQDWKYDDAALSSTSMMVMNPVMRWLTANIGYHHVHHLNSRIPFYRLEEAMAGIPELQDVTITSWNPVEMFRCFQLKLWDAENGKMITLKEFKKTRIVLA